MKSIVFLLLFLFVPKLCVSQVKDNDYVVYLDSLGKETTEEKQVYFRITTDYFSEKENYSFVNYYKSGIIESIGVTKNKDKLYKEGSFITFYENGNRKCISNYKNGILNGMYYELYENGQKKLEGEYVSKKNKCLSTLIIKNFWDTDKVQKVTEGMGVYQINNNKESSKGSVKNGFKDGIWAGRTKCPNITYNETYKKGKLVYGVSIDSVGIEHKYKEEFTYPSKRETSKLNSFIIKNIIKPQEALNKNISAKIIMNFTIEKNGKITDIVINKGYGYGLDKEIKRILQSYNEWKFLGFVRGIPSKIMCFFPINIIL